MNYTLFPHYPLSQIVNITLDSLIICTLEMLCGYLILILSNKKDNALMANHDKVMAKRRYYKNQGYLTMLRYQNSHGY